MESSSSKVGSGQHPYPYAYTENDTDPVGCISDIGLQIVANLAPKELGNCLVVSKKWSPLASAEMRKICVELSGVEIPADIKVAVPAGLKIIDGLDWKKYVKMDEYGLSVEDEPLFDRAVEIAKLKKGLSLPIEEGQGITYLTIPKGLTIKKLIEIAATHDLIIRISNDILEEYGDIKVEETYRVVLTNSILEESRGDKINSSEDFKTFVEKIHCCSKQKIVESMALDLLTFMSTGKRLYPEGTYTYCAELIEYKGKLYPTVVGGFSPSGFDVYYDFRGFGLAYRGAGVAVR